jgi:TPR repeat protein
MSLFSYISTGVVNKKEAMIWYKKSADHGHPPSMYNYRLGLQIGYLGVANQNEAKIWIQKSSQLGHKSHQDCSVQ